MMNKEIFSGRVVFSINFFAVTRASTTRETRTDGKTLIIDQTRDRWNVTQALELAFEPERFQHGIDKHALLPLG